jgi:hypothetical protein
MPMDKREPVHKNTSSLTEVGHSQTSQTRREAGAESHGSLVRTERDSPVAWEWQSGFFLTLATER